MILNFHVRSNIKLRKTTSASAHKINNFVSCHKIKNMTMAVIVSTSILIFFFVSSLAAADCAFSIFSRMLRISKTMPRIPKTDPSSTGKKPAPGTPSEAFRFVQRNRIIAALSSGTVIMQAPNGSGSLLTAEFALEYNRDLVFHEVCFSCDAQKIREDVKKRQAKELSDGKINASKAERTVESFLAQGASVIKDYADYKKFLAEVPGTRSAKNQQFSLFEV